MGIIIPIERIRKKQEAEMGFVFNNGNSARCRDCRWFTEEIVPGRGTDGRCTNAAHVRTHGGSDRVSSRQHTCFDAEAREDGDADG